MVKNPSSWLEVVELLRKFKKEPTSENRLKICDRLYQYEQEILPKPQPDEIEEIIITDKKEWAIMICNRYGEFIKYYKLHLKDGGLKTKAVADYESATKMTKSEAEAQMKALLGKRPYDKLTNEYDDDRYIDIDNGQAGWDGQGDYEDEEAQRAHLREQAEMRQEDEVETFDDWFNSFDEASKHNILNMMDS